MELNDALNLGQRLIDTQEKHRDYERTVTLANDYYIYRTGENIGSKLVQFTARESDVLFKQRLQITRSITPAMASSVETAFNKVTRNDRIRKTLKLGDNTRLGTVENMMKRFYGSARKQNRGLDYFIKTRFKDLSFVDPNAWVVIEWDAPQTPADVIIPRPFEVKAKEAVNFYMENENVHWLLVKQEIQYPVNSEQNVGAPLSPLGVSTKQPVGLPQTGSQVQIIPQVKKTMKKEGFRYTLYDEDYTIVWEQIDLDYFKKSGREIDGSFQQIVKVKEAFFVQSWYEPKIGYVPAFRIGYNRDEVTDGRTFVNPWHDALCYFDKTLKTVSEMDLTMTLHVFPQKIQYVQKCAGEVSGNRVKPCKGGLTVDGAKCGACNGQGYKLHTSAQDAMLLPLPDNPTSSDILPLDNLIAYKAPPIETVKFQNEYILQLERQVHQAVYNSQVFIRKNNSTSIVGDGVQTATENDNNMQSVYDTLEPFTEKISEFYCDCVITFAILAGDNVDSVEVSHTFPSDYKLKTNDILMSERKAASDSGAPAFLLETIDEDLATVTFQGDPGALLKFRVKRRYFPFNGKSPDEITQAVASQYVADDIKILYMNFEQIFKEIELENPGFWFITNLVEQKKIVDDMVAKFSEAIKSSQPTFSLDQFRQSAPGITNPDSSEDGDNTDYGTDDDNPGTTETDNQDDDKNPVE